MSDNIVAFVGENANDIIAVENQRVMDVLKPLGMTGHIISLRDPDFPSKLDSLVAEGILFAWGAQGMGANLNLEQVSLWDKINVPFVSLHADPPFSNPRSHFVRARNVVNGYYYTEWADIQRNWIRSPQMSSMFFLGIPPVAERDALAWSKRPRRMAVVKTGVDPAGIRESWAGWPNRLRPVLEDSIDVLSRLSTRDIVPATLSCIDAHGLNFHEAKDVLFAVLNEVDRYIRNLRATTLVKALRHLPVDIIGDGWGHVSRLGGRARYHPSIHASGLQALYAETQYLVNANPNFASGPHERVLQGFAAKACVVSDDNDFSRARFADVPSYHGVDWTDPDLTDRMSDIYADKRDFGDALQPALDYVQVNNDPLVFMSRLLEAAELIRTREIFNAYRY